MRVEPLSLSGPHIVVLEPHRDRRGWLTRLYSREAFLMLGIGPVAQINHTLTRRVGAVRGMHFQHPPHAENKLITCLRGRVFDVFVDVRMGSSTFLSWQGIELAAGSNHALFLPRGFAHGFQVLEEDSELLYVHDAPYEPHHEGAVHAQDPRLAIAWPLTISELSDRDRSLPFVDESFKGVGL
jgi:dTDP-4-dehydrorhamnose 3,5-epimerase